MKRIILFIIVITIFQFNILHSAILKVIHSDENTITFYYKYHNLNDPSFWKNKLLSQNNDLDFRLV